MPHFIDETPAESGTREHRKLVLCFDGTGNVFNGNTSDTNIVKLYDKFDRKDPLQYHYYQTGIGTYSINGGSLNKGPFGNIVSKISKSIDSGFATTFDSHVMAGYRFIMRYYKEGDKIYIFGFSRGAFTARFLARMIYTVGLLSEGNEEMIPFAYDLYQQYEQGLLDASEPEQQGCSNTTKPVNETHTSAETQPILPKGLHTDDCLEHDAQQLVKNKLNAFKTTFCRSKNADNSDIKVHFLGMFDCVSSVAVLDSPFGQAPKAVSVLGTAHHIRHAVAVDEHRVKFKAALLQQDQMQAGRTNEDIKEVWFPGNHGDVGGGWPAAPSSAGKKPQPQKSWWRRIFRSLNDPNASNPGTDPYQMSDIPLAWMIRELEILGDKDPASAIKWNSRKKGFKTHFFDKKKEAYNGVMHDTLRIGGGSSLFKVMLWNFMEWLPFRRWELKKDTATNKYKWSYDAFPLNRGGARDIPGGALLHDSLRKRLTNTDPKVPKYCPTNNLGEGSTSCFVAANFAIEERDDGFAATSAGGSADPPGIHDIYKLKA